MTWLYICVLQSVEANNVHEARRIAAHMMSEEFLQEPCFNAFFLAVQFASVDLVHTMSTNTVLRKLKSKHIHSINVMVSIQLFDVSIFDFIGSIVGARFGSSFPSASKFPVLHP